MSHDPENLEDSRGAAPGGNSAPLLANHSALVDRLLAESGGCSWGLTRGGFVGALERSARKRFSDGAANPQEIEAYLGALHLQDLALATACIDGHAEAWEQFVAAYRGYLRAAAGAILRSSVGSPAACELADSLFAELYGLSDAKRGERSLLRYFHGRSSLKTWLRAVLAQRHVDAIRAGRRFSELEDDDANASAARHHSQSGSHQESPADPHRERYVALFTRALHVEFGLLDPRDHQRLRLYYAEERTLAEIGRVLGEHESSVSRNLERTRRELRHAVETALRKDRAATNGASPEPGLSDEQIALCLEYASEDAPIDLDKLFAPPAPSTPKVGRREP
jgi:RNA polymerase sigma factor (sigma-70 family)